MYKYLISTVALFILFVGCGKKETQTTEPTAASTTPPTIETVTFQGPSKTNTDPTYHAQAAAAYASSFNALLWSAQVLAYLPGQQSGNTWTWTVPDNNGTWTYKAQRNADGSYTWQYLYTGTLSGKTYNNFVYWYGVVSADGKSGSWDFYDLSDGYKEMKYEYTVNAQGVKTGTLQYFTPTGIVEKKIVLVNNPDNSGSCDEWELKSDNVTLYKSLHIEWTASGSGSWKEYNEAGTVTNQGTWQ